MPDFPFWRKKNEPPKFVVSTAQLCPNIDGRAVYIAKSIYSTFDEEIWNFEPICDLESNENLKISNPGGNLQNSLLEVFPNPANEELTVNLPLVNESTYSRLEIIDITGKVIFQQSIKEDQNTIEIDLQDMKNGVYFLKVISQNKSTKIVKFNVIH